ncbi:odorant receptor 131-2-like [Centropristis striata]|uniref:odorant receptor 131-2-like n=1 Tax=Centropristis striata TaxID=184440 RepID=UPI0027DF69EB|nr:odorant receptor 131-2-like [Centropristis striata]
MADNMSLVVGKSLRQQLRHQVIVLHILVMTFLCINLLLIVIFFKKCFYTTTRYILFAVTLLSDSLIIILSDVLLLMTHFKFTIQIGLCIVLYFPLALYTLVTPVTLTAMTLERYVAICMPLRHGELCSTRNTNYCILIIHGLSSIQCIVVLSIFFTSASLSFYQQNILCSVEIFILYKWQSHVKSAINQFYFLIMFILIVSSYVKIIKVAKTASGENKKSTWKGLRTVILHGFQLLLCLIQLWCPFIEDAVFQINLLLYGQIRYFNYITFYLAPRCLSPLIYGLRDEKFFLALKDYVLCGFVKNGSICVKS